MNANNPIRLLILNDSREEAHRLVSMLTNSGKQVDAQHVESEEALTKVLQEHSWDLLIGHAATTNTPPEAALKQIRKLNKDVPVILITEDDGTAPIVDGLKKGVADVLMIDEDQHLLQVIQRELANREYRSQSRYAQRRLKEIERKNQQLLDSSKDAIGFVQDGMFLYVNESFAQMLGYESKDDLECTPLIDSIDPADQNMLRDFFKDIPTKGTSLDAQVLAFKMVNADGSSDTVHADISVGTYDDETCVQILVPGAASKTTALATAPTIASPAALSPRSNENATGITERATFIERLHRAMDIAVDNEHTGAVIHIQIQDFIQTTISKVGAIATERVTKNLALHLKGLCPENSLETLFSSDAFLVLIPKTQAQEALDLAKNLCSRMRDHFVDIDGASLQFQFFVGVGLFSETTTTPDTPIVHAIQASALASKDPEKLAVLFEQQDEDGEAPERSNKDLERLIQKALENSRFKLLFQPVLSLRGSDQEHYEVLLRMLDSKGTEITPDKFMDVAQNIGFSAKIDRWVILEALKTLTKHRANGHNTRLILNLSEDSIRDKTLPDWLAIAFRAAKLPADSVVFQLNEAEVCDRITQAKVLTEKLAEIGCAVSISRFGCTTNPLNALQHVPATYIKLDGSYTQELQAEKGDNEKFKALIAELHSIEKITIVPFVENASVLSKLWQSGVHYIQGYYLQAPTENMDYEFDAQ